MKLLYNVTIKIDLDIAEEWETWMKQEHIPDVMATACFSAYKFTKILGDEDEQGLTFAIQYISPSETLFSTYQSDYAKQLQAKHAKKYQNKYVAFRTLMEIIKES